MRKKQQMNLKNTWFRKLRRNDKINPPLNKNIGTEKNPVTEEFVISEELKKMPEQPGVYIMRNQQNEVIYVGKAVNLKNRVKQYFQSHSGHSRKVKAMVSQIKTFEYIITGTEKEALILECNLIKRYKPKYNILFRDDKTYPYIKVTTNEEYPRIFMTRKVEKDGARYFGPYTSSNEVRETINFLTKTFLIRTCKKKIGSKKERPCLNYYINKCMAPCYGGITSEQYREAVKEVCDFLSGKEKELLEKLENEMLAASQDMNFEKAAELRDKINSIKNMFQEQKVVSTTDTDDEDVIAYAIKNGTACVQIFFIREGKLIGRKYFIIDNMEEKADDEREMIVSFVQQFYDSAENIPKNILLPIEIGEEENSIEEWLEEKKGSKVYIKLPKKGEKFKLVKMVAQNAETYLDNYLKTGAVKKQQNINAIEQLMEFIGLKKYPRRIEAYDISNTGGTDITGAMVVFIDGEPASSQYRRFRIKSLSQPDDYAAMQEMLFRRFRNVYATGVTRKVQDTDDTDNKALDITQERTLNKSLDDAPEYPDLILIDGGLGHVNAAMEVIRHYNLGIPLFGMVKDDKHKTRGLVSLDKEFDLQNNKVVLSFITKIQDEAHRFALEYNKKLRSKRYSKSVLDEIEGVGNVRKRELIKHFKSVDKIKSASIEELMQVKGITRTVAENIYEFFNKR